MTGPAAASPDRWIDDDAGPVVRPYAMTGGRTRPRHDGLDLISLVVTVRWPAATDTTVGPEQRGILQLCHAPLAVAEIAAHLDLPLGTVRVLLSDLLELSMVQVRNPSTAATGSDDVLAAILDGLRAL